MKTTLVTGGMGLIGKALIRKLISETDDRLIIVDNLSSSKFDSQLISNSRIIFYNSCFEEWESTGYKFDKIYHLTSPVGPLGVLKYKGRIAQMILQQLYVAAEIALRDDAKIIEISTSEVYGSHPEMENLGQMETLNNIVPSNYTVRLEYGVAKMLCEIVLKNLSRDTKLKYLCIRPFNIVGPRQNDKLGFIIPRFLRQIQSYKPLTVYGDGSQKRTFTHVNDFVSAIYLLMESNISNEIFNVGNPDNLISIKELSEKFITSLNYKPGIIYVDPINLFKDFAEAWNKVPNINKLHDAIGFKPSISLDQIIFEAITDKDYLPD